MAKILLLDNYDSFVFNLARYCEELGAQTRVFRSDQITIEQIEKLNPSHIIISPGPCTPNEAGVSLQCIKSLAGKIPILGVCLGHQAIAQALGGKIIRAAYPMHGKVEKIRHNGQGIFVGIPNPFDVTRYHSLVADKQSLPKSLQVNSCTDAGEIMAFSDYNNKLFGVQFHPEAVLTESGHQLIKNFLNI